MTEYRLSNVILIYELAYTIHKLIPHKIVFGSKYL